MSTMTRRSFISAAAGAAALLAGCAGQTSEPAKEQGSAETSAAEPSVQSQAAEEQPVQETLAAPEGLAIDSGAWSYDADADIYYQIGVPYCTAPQATDYESMGIYVPGAYFSATDNGDGTFTCAVNEAGEKGDWSATTAPVVMPINTAGYSAQKAPSSYSSNGIASYTDAGLIYVYAGCRGRDITEAAGNAPWGVTDLKAAVRTLRVNASVLPGDLSKVFSFGHSGGGAQSAVFGATGDAAGYEPYLAAIGAPLGEGISDAIAGAMCWCPITNLDQADAAYEWNMGQFSDAGTRAEGSFTGALSDDLAAAYGDYINSLGLVDAAGETLALAEGGEGIFCSGSYYDHVTGVIEDSLNSFLAATEFPYTPSNDFSADMGAGGGGMGGGPMGGGTPPDGGMDGQRGEAPSGERPGAAMGGTPGVNQQGAEADTATYDTAADYIAKLNEGGDWVVYDENTGTARVTSLGGFVGACKSPSKSVGAFDDLDRGQAENAVFGNGAGVSLHFDTTMRDLLAANEASYSALDGWDSSYPSAYAEDIELADAQGNASEARQNLYNPMYYLCDAYEGAGSSTPAAHWRIRTGIEQGDTALTTEINLALAAAAAVGTDAVDFATVWGKGHTTAELEGSSTDNFIAWVKDCCK